MQKQIEIIKNNKAFEEVTFRFTIRTKTCFFLCEDFPHEPKYDLIGVNYTLKTAFAEQGFFTEIVQFSSSAMYDCVVSN